MKDDLTDRQRRDLAFAARNRNLWPRVPPSAADGDLTVLIERGYLLWSPDKGYNITDAGSAYLDAPPPPVRALRVGDLVEKYTGDYQLAGQVRAVFTTKRGKVRYVVEHEPGFLHIYGPDNLRSIP